MKSGLVKCLRTIAPVCRPVAATGLAGVGVVHGLWAAGSSWPTNSPEELAEAVVGSSVLPSPGACAVVAGGALGAALMVAGVGGDRKWATWSRRLVGAGLVARAVFGGAVAARMLGLPKPGQLFLQLDHRYYRWLCAVLGVSTLVSTQTRAS